jgi:hypothetical protein
VKVIPNVKTMAIDPVKLGKYFDLILPAGFNKRKKIKPYLMCWHGMILIKKSTLIG